ncbi:ferredoxin family protein [Burkholderia sp. Bp8963]|uniref:ferredoxin n=1 Tax=Burkholderia sp. Bp8963 TaxID=2184547 RepID=UPI000F5B4805|nr:ferredoxin [Burkholderia sp. Bp8963]RQS66650.1 ferredoxin family protein [Burkholderia sp. Bp8963]
MAYVITSPCIDVKDGACVKCCPVDCIYEGGRTLYIHPDECVNCGICVSVCPTEAIFHEEELPATEAPFALANREFFDASVSGLGLPGGACDVGKTACDHPLVAAWPAITS